MAEAMVEVEAMEACIGDGIVTNLQNSKYIPKKHCTTAMTDVTKIDKKIDNLAHTLTGLLQDRYVNKKPKAARDLKTLREKCQLEVFNLTTDQPDIFDQIPHVGANVNYLWTMLKIDEFCYWSFLKSEVITAVGLAGDNERLGSNPTKDIGYIGPDLQSFVGQSKEIMKVRRFLIASNEDILEKFKGYQLKEGVLTRLRQEFLMYVSIFGETVCDSIRPMTSIKVMNNGQTFSFPLLEAFHKTKNEKCTILKQFSMCCTILSNLNCVYSPVGRLQTYMEKIKSAIIKPVMSLSHKVETFRPSESNRYLKTYTIKPANPSAVAHANVKFVSRFLIVLHRISLENTVFREVFKQVIWDEFRENFFYGDFFRKMLERADFSSLIYPEYESFQKELGMKSECNNQFKILGDEEFITDIKKKKEIVVLSELAKQFGLSTEYTVEKVDYESIQNLNKSIIKIRTKADTMKFVKSCGFELILESNLTSTAMNLLKLFWKLVNRAESVMKCKDSNFESIFDLFTSFDIIKHFVTARRKVYCLENSVGTIEQARQAKTDCQVIIWQILEAINNNSCFLMFPKKILAVFGVDCLTEQLQLLGNDSMMNAFRKRINEILRMCDVNKNSENQDLNQDVNTSEAMRVLKEFTSQSKEIFTGILDNFVDTFIKVLLQKYKIEENSENKENNSENREDSQKSETTSFTVSKEMYQTEVSKNHPLQNKFISIVQNQIKTLYIELQTVVNEHLSLNNDENQELGSVGLKKLEALTKFCVANLQTVCIYEANLCMFNAKIPETLLQLKNYQGILKNSDLFSIDEKHEFNQWFYDEKVAEIERGMFSEKKSIGWTKNGNGKSSKRAIMGGK